MRASLQKRRPIATLSVSSTAFENGAAIPTKYTALGKNINPPLSVAGILQGTESLAIVVQDPIVPGVFS